jgi:hypothetical protein
LSWEEIWLQGLGAGIVEGVVGGLMAGLVLLWFSRRMQEDLGRKLIEHDDRLARVRADEERERTDRREAMRLLVDGLSAARDQDGVRLAVAALIRPELQSLPVAVRNAYVEVIRAYVADDEARESEALAHFANAVGTHLPGTFES